MDLKKFRNFNWIEMDSKDQNLDLTRTKRIYFCPFQSIFLCREHIFLRTSLGRFCAYELDLFSVTFFIFSLFLSHIYLYIYFALGVESVNMTHLQEPNVFFLAAVFVVSF